MDEVVVNDINKNKDDCWRCLEYLCKEKESLLKDEQWDESRSQLYEELEEYCRAIHDALETIEYYEGCSAIVKAKEGADYIKSIGMEWFKAKTAAINEKLGIGYEKEEKKDDE